MAGSALSWLQYVLGLRALGHDVLYLEDAGGWFYDHLTLEMIRNVAIPVSHLSNLMNSFDLHESWTFVDEERREYGLGGARLRDFLSSADLLIHVTGAMSLKYDPAYMKIPVRAYVDTDPGFIQARVASGNKRDLEHLNDHTVHFSFGGNIGRKGCAVPATGHDWRPTVQPIFLPLWSEQPVPPKGAPFTTIVKWDPGGHGPMPFKGRVLGAKHGEFAKFVTLPQHLNRPLEIAMAGRAPIADLESFGWQCRSGPEVSSTIAVYQKYIRDSAGEWSVAKNAYVTLNTGWFSDRSAAYLASGRPVVLQSTGFKEWLPCGIGLLTFTTLAEAIEAIRAVDSAAASHCRAARDLALSHFESSVVLSRLIEICFGAQGSSIEFGAQGSSIENVTGP